MAWTPLTPGAAAQAIPAALERGGWQEAFRVVIQLIIDIAGVPDAEVPRLLDNRPAPTGDKRFDALLAGVVEDLCLGRGLPAPGWVAEPERFLDEWWFVEDVPALHGSAMARAPAALAIRGVFVPRESLESV